MKEIRTIPEWFYEKIEFMAGVSSDLARKRGPAFYGFERSVTPASKIFGREEGLSALRGLRKLWNYAEDLLRMDEKNEVCVISGAGNNFS